MFVKSSDAKNHRKNHLKTFLKDKVVVIINFWYRGGRDLPGEPILAHCNVYIFIYILSI